MALIQALQLTAGSLRERVKEAFRSTTERNSPPDGAQYELTDPEITAYFRSLAMDWPEADVIDDRTWSDLEMEREYVRKEQGRFTPTMLGERVSILLVKSFDDVFAVTFTARLEEELDEIEEGKLPWRDAVREFWGKFVVDLDR